MDLNSLLNAAPNGAAPHALPPPPPAVPQAGNDARISLSQSARGSPGAPARRPRWPPAQPVAATAGWMWARGTGGRNEGGVEGQGCKLSDHTGLPGTAHSLEHNFTPDYGHTPFHASTPMIAAAPQILAHSHTFAPQQRLSTPIPALKFSPTNSPPVPHPHVRSSPSTHPPHLSHRRAAPATYGASPLPAPHPPPPPPSSHAAFSIPPIAQNDRTGLVPMKRTAARLPAGSERRRKRTPMRSIGAPIVRPVETYPMSADSDLEDAVVSQSLAPSRQPLQSFVPAHPARPNGNRTQVGSGSMHVSGHLRDVGATSAAANRGSNGSLKCVPNGSLSGVANGIGNTAPSGVGNTIVIDVDALPSPSALTPSRPAAEVNGTFVRKPRPAKTAAPISPAARWEAKMEARRSVVGPPGKAGPSTKSALSKAAATNAAAAGRATCTSQPNGPAPAVVKKKKKRVRKKKQPPPPDPDVPYPKFSENFENIAKDTVGDMLQIYDFCIAFSKTLALSPFSLRALELALSVQERNPLIDAIVVRLIRTILDDKAACAELDLSPTAVGNLKSGKSADAAEKTFKELPYLLSFDNDDGHEDLNDESLRDVFLKMRSSPQVWSLYEVLTPTERLRVLRELVDRAASTEDIRACVINSLEFEEEERKKAREEIFAQRRAAETQLRELRAELLAFRGKHGLLPNAIAAAAADAKAKAEAEKAAAAKAKKAKKKSKGKSSRAAAPKAPTRKELIIAAQKERAEAAKRKAIEREEENLLQKIEKVKATIKAMKARSAKPGATKKELVDSKQISAEEAAAIGAAVEAEEHLDRAERNEDDPVRMHPLGTDREHRRYWYFAGGGRLWVENSLTNSWMHAEEPALIEGLLKWCSPHRKPERALKTVLEKKKTEIEEGMKALGKTKEKEHAARERIKNAPRTRAGKRKTRESLNGGSSAADVAFAPYLAYRNTLA